MIWSLQILRFVAATMVVYVHAAQVAIVATGSASDVVPHALVGLGLTGVDLFFVISGVVIAKTAPSLTPTLFMWRRIRRIIPFYYLCCIPALLMAVFSADSGWRELVATFLLWPATDVMTAPLLGVAWTLCFEMLFYGCAALVLLDRRWLYALLALYAGAFALRSMAPLFQFLGNPLILEFVFGVAIARARLVRAGIWFLPLGFVALLCAGLLNLAPTGGTLDFLSGSESIQRVFVIGIPAALIVYGAIHWKTRPTVWTDLGDASYSIYLVHVLIVTSLQALWTAFPIQPDVITVVTTGAAVVFAWRVHKLFELPILGALPKQIGRSASF